MNNRGISCLGLCHPRYDIKNLLKAFQAATEIRFGWLDKFFNPDNNEKAKRVLREPKPKWCRVHIINGPGMNNGRTCSHEITYKENTNSVVKKINSGNKKFLNAFEKRVQVVRQVLQANVGPLDLCISPWLEHEPIPINAFKKLAAIILENIPEAKIVDNPRSGALFPGFLHEKHGNEPNPENLDIADLDGLPWEGMDVVAYGRKYKNLRACLIWNLGDNGIAKDEPWQHPAKRTAFTGSRDMRVYKCFVGPSALIEKNQPVLEDSSGLNMHNPQDGYKRDFVWKLGDGRNYAICLLPRFLNGVKVNKVIIKRGGQVVDKAKYRGKYTEDGTNRQIWDFSKHTDSFPDNCVLQADNHGWLLPLPQFRID